MSRTTLTPTPARTDDATGRVDDAHEDRIARAASVDLGFVRRRGAVLAAGAAAWGTTSLTLGFNPETSFGMTLQDLTGFAFQVGVMALLGVQARTMATGTSRAARLMFPVERVVLGIAMLWSLLHAVPALRDAAWLPIVDLAWPLSMLGMFVIGVKILLTKRWRGAARIWPLVAESWAIVCVPVFVVVGGVVSDVVGGGHLFVGYVTLGLLLALRPELTRPAR